MPSSFVLQLGRLSPGTIPSQRSQGMEPTAHTRNLSVIHTSPPVTAPSLHKIPGTTSQGSPQLASSSKSVSGGAQPRIQV